MDSDKKHGNRTYLTFTLDQEVFAVDVACVREVLDFTEITRVPRMPDFMKGVINLRGRVVPVVDLRLKFGLPEAEKTVDTCIVVLEVEMEGELTVIGAVADSVKEVFELSSDDIEPPPKIGTPLATEFISGMGRHEETFIIILDVNSVFSARELEIVRYADTEGPDAAAGAHQRRANIAEGDKEPEKREDAPEAGSDSDGFGETSGFPETPPD